MILVAWAPFVGLSACSGEQPRDPGPIPSSVSPSIGPTTPAPPPEAEAALAAYNAFSTASNEAQRHPVAFGKPLPAGADFAKYSFDPLRTAQRGYVDGLAAGGVAFRGTAPTPNAAVASVDLAAKPNPIITLTACEPDPADWEAYVVRTGKKAPKANGAVPPPYRLTLKLIFLDGRWGVQTSSADTSRTCQP